ncbi:FAD-dependent oxidoreductase [Microbacterium sp. RD1]|uniref:FAD-dependent oxidoreductase n=1 Tax=Microbacterium sp. RD1 TaxID=3457313 RepID=UPI003FA575F5
MDTSWDAIIIGGGVAGLSAAQMLGRSRRRTLVLDAGEPRNRFAAHMHGVLGHDGVDPVRLLATGREEARAYGVEFASGTVTAVTDDGDRMRVTRGDGTSDAARVVVLTTGVRDDLPPLPGLSEGWGRTVLHCPYCHGWEVAGGRLAVLATSPMSLHQVELVRQLSDDVTAFTAGAGALPDDVLARFAARGIRVVPAAVRGVRHDEVGLTVRTAEGNDYGVDAIFTAGTPDLALGFAATLDLARADQPGSPVAADMRGATSHPRVFAAGNVIAPFANVPLSMGSGSMAGAGANAMLAAEDFDRAVSARTAERNADWERRYAERERFWSGRVNATVAAVVEGLTPGRALDVGCGEGGDAVWLAARGWDTSAVDVSATAVERARKRAGETGVDVDFHVGDGAAAVEGEFDLVLASFLHSEQQDFPRIRLLREAADRVAVGGHLLVVSHIAPPAGEHHDGGHAPLLRSPEEEWALLALDPAGWEAVTVATIPREADAPGGRPAHLEDGVVLARRLP